MVNARRDTCRGKPMTNGTCATLGEGEMNETIRVQQPRYKNRVKVYTSPEPRLANSTTTPSSTGGMENISLTSPSVTESLISDISITPKRKREPQLPERTLSSALRQLVAKSSNSKGSAHNPIVLEEYSPRRKPIPLPPRTEPEQEPHKFKKRHRKLYAYHPDRPALAPKPASGNTLTGDKSGDMYRMMNAKGIAAGWTLPLTAANSTPPIAPANWTPPTATANVTYGVPFAVQYPMSAQYMSQQPVSVPIHSYESPYARYHNSMGVTLSGDSEDMLREKALQYARESSWLHNRKNVLSSDPDETSADESAAASPSITVSMYSGSSSAVKKKKLQVYQDPNKHISPLITQTSLLTSLLQIYHKSTDQKGLREDIAMLVLVQNQRVKEWMRVESETVRERRRSDAGMSRARRAVNGLLAEEKKKKDNAMRDLLSAGAGMWQDGSGEGVADVFADQGSVPVQTALPVSLGIVRAIPAREAKRKLGVCGWDLVR
jgi:hypothetical protein